MEPAAANPYAPPRAEVEPTSAPDNPAAPLATRFQRFGGALVDGAARWAANSVIYFSGVSRAEVAARDKLNLYTKLGYWGYVAAAATLILAAVQWYLITRRGQSLGKMMARSRIVRLDGGRVDFLHAVVLRSWVLEAPGLALPLLGFAGAGGLGYALALLFLADILLIFGPARRCLHDRLAGTKVIDLDPYVEPARHAPAPRP